MGRLSGLGSFAIIVLGMLAVLRVVHVGVPLVITDVHPGPFVLASLDDVEPRIGFAPVLPAYHPVALGERPTTMIARLMPRPTLELVWQGEHMLSLTQRRGGTMPDHPPVSQALEGVADSRWWQEGARSYLVVRYEEFWITVETDLPTRDLRRFAVTLGPYEEAGY
jgi:hypothetical protein